MDHSRVFQNKSKREIFAIVIILSIRMKTDMIHNKDLDWL